MRDEWPLVSVIIPTCDRPHLLPIALACYREQTYPRRELLVVDDGQIYPADEAAVVAAGGRVLRAAPGTPLGTKLNLGAEAARGTYCQKMDDDDWYAPRFIETLHAAVRDDAQIVCRPTIAALKGFLFFDLARWELRRSLEFTIPGATLFFAREDWRARPFRAVRSDEDVWFVLDQLGQGGTMLPIVRIGLFVAVRHRGSGGRDHTWTHQGSGLLLDDHLRQRPRYKGGPEAVLPAWALARYRAIRDRMRGGAMPAAAEVTPR